MSPAHVFEPTYAALIDRLKNGFWRPGTRLETAKICEDLGVSMAPVRDSLCRLAGEHLVSFQPGEGFRVPVLSEADFRDLLEVNAILLLAALTATPPLAPAPPKSSLRKAAPAERFAAIFIQIAERSGNQALCSHVANLNDRLHVFRKLDPEFSASYEQELSIMDEEISNIEDSGKLKISILSHHHLRSQSASQYIRGIIHP